MSLMGNVVLAVLGLATMFLLYHSLSKADAGKWFTFMTVLGLCESIRNGFLGTATVKFYAGTDAHRANVVLGSVWTLAIGLTASVLLLNALAYVLMKYMATNNEQVLLIISWLGLTYLSSLPFGVIFWKLQADEDYTTILYLRLVNSGSMIICFFILFLAKKMTLESALLYNFLTNCLTSVVGVLMKQSRLTALQHRTRESIMELFHFGKFSLGSTLSSTLLRSSDTFIVSAFLGPEAVAVFTLPARLMELIELPLRSFVATGMSGMSRAFNSDNMEQVGYIFRKYAGMLTMAFIPMAIAALLLADVPINLLGGHKYQGSEAANIYRMFMVFAILYPIDRFNGVVLDVIHKPKANFYKVLLMLAVNIISDYAGVMLFRNVYGAAFAAFLTNLTGLIFGYYYLNQYLPYSVPGIFRTGYEESKLFLRSNMAFLRAGRQR